jgi:hypothetical protein
MVLSATFPSFSSARVNFNNGNYLTSASPSYSASGGLLILTTSSTDTISVSVSLSFDFYYVPFVFVNGVINVSENKVIGLEDISQGTNTLSPLCPMAPFGVKNSISVNYTGGSPACFVAYYNFVYIIGEGLNISVQQIDRSFRIIEGTTLGPAEDVYGFHLENRKIVVIWVNGSTSQEISFLPPPELPDQMLNRSTVKFEANFLTDPSTKFRVRNDTSLLKYLERNITEDIEVIAGVYLQTGTAIVEANLDGSDELLFPRGFVNQFFNATRSLSTGRTLECPFVFYASGDFELSIRSQNPNAKNWGRRIVNWSTDSFGLLYYDLPPFSDEVAKATKKGLNGGEIAGIIIGGAVFVLIVFVGVLFFLKEGPFKDGAAQVYASEHSEDHKSEEGDER